MFRGSLRCRSAFRIHRRPEPARGAGVRAQPRDGFEDVPVFAAAGLHANEAGGEAEAGAAAGDDRRDPVRKAAYLSKSRFA